MLMDIETVTCGCGCVYHYSLYLHGEFVYVPPYTHAFNSDFCELRVELRIVFSFSTSICACNFEFNLFSRGIS